MPRNSTTLITALSAGNFVIGMGAFMVVGILVPLTDGLSITASDAGLVMTMYALAYTVFSPLGVALTGSLDRRPVLLAGLAMFGVGALICAMASSLPVLLAARVLAAIGAGLFSPVAAGIALAASEPGGEGRALSRVFFGVTLAQVAGVPVGGWLAFTFGWQSAFVVVVVLAALAGFALVRLVPGKLEFQVNGFAALGSALKDGKGLFAVLFTTSYLASVYIVFTYLAVLLDARHGLERDGVTAVLVLFGFGAVVGNMLGGHFNDRIGSQSTLMLLCLMQICCLPLFSQLPLPFPLLLTLTFVWSCCCWAFMAPQQTRLVHLRPERRNVVLSLNASAIYAGTAIGSWLGSLVLEGFGMDALGWAAALAMLATTGHLMLSTRINAAEPAPA